MSKAPVMINNYEYAEFSIDANQDGQNVVCIYNIDDETMNQLETGTVIKWNDEANQFLNDDGMIWNGYVYAVFNDFVMIVLY
jgi:hypothetical protein